jgi:hypothetical protein
MFRKVPNLKNSQIYYKNNEFNFTLNLEGMYSSIEDVTNFGVLLYSTTNKIQNYKPTINIAEDVVNTKIVYLDSNIKPLINNNVVKYSLPYSTKYEQENVYVYITTFKKNIGFEQINKELLYFFGNTIEIQLKLDNKINKSILDYSVVEKLNSINPSTLSSKELSAFSTSNLYTSFIDYKKIRNFLFVNHALLCQQQNNNIGKIINYNSSIVNQFLIIPSIRVKDSKGKLLQYSTAVYNKFNYITFDDFYKNNEVYEFNIDYDFSQLSIFLTDSISNYKKTNSKSFEAAILGILNIERNLYLEYISFLSSYGNSTQQQEYNLNSLFDSLLDYCELSKVTYDLPVAKSPNISADDSIIINRQLQVPFDESKYFSFSSYSNVDNNIIVKPNQVKYNEKTEEIKNNKQLYNVLLMNSNKASDLTFNSILNNRYTTIVKKPSPFKPSKKQLVKNDLIEDYKITNQKVIINDVFSKYPTDVPKPLKLTESEKQKDDELIRKVTHKMLGTIDEYQNADTLNLNYYVQVAFFNPRDLKNIEWSNLTFESLSKFDRNSSIFIRIIPDFSNTNLKKDIFNFSYNIVQIINVSELLENVS